jgi:hypothetical protein
MCGIMIRAGIKCGCCQGPWNVMKIDPSNGNILWKVAVGTSANALSIEPLSGTNDVLVPTSDKQLFRINSSGVATNLLSGLSQTIGFRQFDSDGTYIVYIDGAGTAVKAIDYSGTAKWSNSSVTSSGTTVRYGGGKFVTGKLSGNQLTYGLFPSTGGVSWTYTQTGSGPPFFLDWDGSTYLMDVRSTGSYAQSLRSTVNGNVIISTNTFPVWGVARWCGTKWLAQTKLTTGDNLTLSGSAILSGLSIADVAGSTTNNQFFGAYAAKSFVSGHYYSIFAVNSSGTSLWNQLYSSTNNQCTGCCLGNDGYLYVSGQLVSS